ncbi:MAG: hypothetical protein QUS14_13055 [Pyrinomonadaceae bacterium]|nr:hypothetical protein [Pyrinomonadaceae bacterium]
MNKLYACIIVKDEGERIREKEDEDPLPALGLSPLVEIADQFAYRIEAIEGGILFDVSGLENRIGTPSQIALSIAHEMDVRGVEGNLAVAANAATAELYARTKPGVTVIEDGEHQPLPLSMIGLDEDTLKVFHALGMRSTSDLREIPEDELIARYGREFRKTLDLIEQKGSHILMPNLKDNTVSWAYQLDFPVDDFEQLIFIVGHGFGKLLDEAGRIGYSSEEFEITLGLENKAEALSLIHI